MIYSKTLSIIMLLLLIFILIRQDKNFDNTRKKRICVIFRGENLRHKRGTTSALECVDNWKETILDVIECDVVFFTYPSTILNELIDKMSPVHVCTTGYDSQDSNALAALNWMVDNQKKYDRFVLLRYDAMYRQRITEWPHWNKNGVTFVNRDVHYPSRRLYHDIVFVIDHEWVVHFRDAFVADEKKFRICLHHIGRELEDMKIVPIHVMYDQYYHLTNHPFYALHPSEQRPHVPDTYQGEAIKDLSHWNPNINFQSTKIVKKNK